MSQNYLNCFNISQQFSLKSFWDLHFCSNSSWENNSTFLITLLHKTTIALILMKHMHSRKEYQDELHIWVTQDATESAIKFTLNSENVKSVFA